MAKLTRHDLIKGAVLASIPAFLRSTPALALIGPGAESALSDFYGHFSIDDALVKKVMAAALSKGGDYCDLYFQHSIGAYTAMEDNLVNRAYTNVDLGVGIRVVKGDQTGFSFTESLALDAMVRAAQTAANIADGPSAAAPGAFTADPPADYYPILTSWESVKADKKIPHLVRVNDRILATDKRIVKSRVSLQDETSYVLILDSFGKAAYDYRPMTRMSANCTAEAGGRREQGWFDLSGREGLEFYTPANLDHLADMAVQRTLTLFDAVKPKAGEMPVVLAAGSSGILLHEAIGHGMEADFNRKKTSIFADKMGKRVAQPFVSIVDDGTNPNLRGSINVDDEGNPAEKTYMVNDGVLHSYLHDRISAKHYGVSPTGNGRRESFRFPPVPRMRNTSMLPGPHDKDEIIQSVQKGLYAESFSNGQVLIGGGDFSFYVKTGYLIEDGKLGRPVKDVNIIGNGPDVLGKVDRVAGDMKFAEGGWTCGKAGQGVPVSMGLPTIRIASVTVGGVDH